MSIIQKVRNWKDYNRSLKKRGAIIFSFDEKYYCELYYSEEQKRGGKVKNVRADEAYDTEEFRKIIHEWGAQDLIPPARTSKAQDELKRKPKVIKEHLGERGKVTIHPTPLSSSRAKRGDLRKFTVKSLCVEAS
jgi:hypothetical protein